MKWLKRIAIVLAALIVLPVVTLLILGQRSGAGQMHASAEISASPAQLWSWIDDGQRLKQWVSWMVEARAWDKPAGVGARRVLVMRDENNGGAIMEIEGTCTEYSPPSRLTMLLAVKDAFDGQQLYRLTDLGNGRTRLDVESRYHLTNPLARLMEPLVTPQAEKKLVGDVARLKSMVESRAEVR